MYIIEEEVIFYFGSDYTNILREINNGTFFYIVNVFMVLYGYFGFMVSNVFYIEKDLSPMMNSN